MQQKTKKWLSLVLAVLLVSACFTGTLLVRAAQDVAIDETHFPDAGFCKIVAEKCDKNGDGILSDSERSSITRMMLPARQEDVLGEGTPIVSLEGIQYFYNLQNLYCADIGLTSLDVSALSKLTQLTCMDNALGTLDLSKNTALTQINCRCDGCQGLLSGALLWGRNQECAAFCRSGEQWPNGGCTHGLCFAPV